MTARFRVRTSADFALVERHVSFLYSSSFSSEESGGSASVLRSASFLRFRVRCLYRTGRVPTWYAADGRLAISLEREWPAGGVGGWVTVATARDDAQAYDDSWGRTERDFDRAEEECEEEDAAASA